MEVGAAAVVAVAADSLHLEGRTVDVVAVDDDAADTGRAGDSWTMALEEVEVAEAEEAAAVIST